MKFIKNHSMNLQIQESYIYEKNNFLKSKKSQILIDELLKIIMLCFLKWRNGEFYNNNEGLLCLNEEDYYILKNKNII